MDKVGSRWRSAWDHRWVKVVVIGTAVLFLSGLGFFFNCGLKGCPDVKLLRAYIPDEASVVLDRQGREVAKLYRVKRTVIALDSMPEFVPQAFIAVEDQRFFEHGGVDWQRVPGAMLANLKSRGVAQGFSTITMQLARNIFPDKLKAQERTVTRKIAEMRVAMKIEKRFTKRDILELYLNQIYFGNAAWGIAGVPQAPSRSNPRADLAAAKRRRTVVLDRMAEQKLISGAEAEEAKASDVRLRRARRGPGQGTAPYFVEQVRQILEDQLGDAIYTQGLKIHTTLDVAAQEVAQEEMARQLVAIERGAYGRFIRPKYAPAAPGAADSTAEEGTNYLQGALVMLDARTGEVLAYIGGRDFNDSKFDRAVLARRQPGSAFKPFVYTAAVQAGYSPNHRLADTPLRLALDRRKFWEPQNYDRTFRGSVTMREALRESRNVPTVRLAEAVGIERVIDTAHQMGIGSDLPTNPAVVLGSAEVTPMELIGSYTGFATLGDRTTPVYVSRVEDRTGLVLWSQESASARVLDPAVAFIMTDMLKDVVNRGTGTAVRAAGYTGPTAGKTGTTQDGADAWYIGYTPRVVLGLWIGFDKRQAISGDASGGHLAAPVWGRIMKRVATPTEDWAPPPGVEQRWLDAGGQIVSADCPGTGQPTREYFIQGQSQEMSCLQPSVAYDVYAGDTLTQYGQYSTGTTPTEDDGWWARMRQRLNWGVDTVGAGEPAEAPPAAYPQPQPAEAQPQPRDPHPELLGEPAAQQPQREQPRREAPPPPEQPRREAPPPAEQPPAPQQDPPPERQPEPPPAESPPPAAEPIPRDTVGATN
jgi:penicillin-binding protein 1A